MDNPQGLQPGVKLRDGKYRIEKILGKGTFGITYLASAKLTAQGALGQMEVDVKVAIKEFFMSELNGRKDDGNTVEGSTGSVFVNYRKKFRKEAENLAKLTHGNIVRVFDVFDENSTSYYVMEFLEGDNLDDYISRRGRLSEEESKAIISEIGGALAYMHSRKMLHLDIKPKNVMRKADGSCHLIDFGLSKQFNDAGEPESSTSIGLGTPGYAPLEQADYKQDGAFPATLDVYALGATMFKMLTGVRPPDATYILNEGFPDASLRELGVSAHTIATLEKAMSPLRKHRFQSIDQFVGELCGDGNEATSIEDEPKIISVTAPNPPRKVGGQPNPITPVNPIPRPIPDVDDDEDDDANRRSPKWPWIVVGCFIIIAICAFIGYKFIGNGEPAAAVADTTDTTRAAASTLVADSDTVMSKEQTVTDMIWQSPLGKASYTGDVLIEGDKKVPHGRGVATILSGEYKDCKYDGELYHGKFEGEASYKLSNDDSFVGTYKNNKYYQGRYTISSTGAYFEGTFINSQPARGAWYDRQGNLISNQ